ncbi:hypothetical protein RQ479_06270 [Mesorhizobium sp. ISC25]|uniref:lysozyme inhibitor LprI family protein n=1 Tax=Mesorhizobium sp. ISC25 TaxID=3077335 RepID=UPI0035DF5D45
MANDESELDRIGDLHRKDDNGLCGKTQSIDSTYDRINSLQSREIRAQGAGRAVRMRVWGFASFVFAFAAATFTCAYAGSPSFDCRKALHDDERTICSDPSLASTDLETTQAFDTLRKTNRQQALAIARKFLARRRACGSDTDCIALSQQWALGQFGSKYAAQGTRPNRSTSRQEPSRLALAFQPNERVVSGSDDGILKIGPHREGLTPDGFFYSFYTDGSGHVGEQSDPLMSGWSISCNVDPMDDVRRCNVTSFEAKLFIFFGSSDKPRICLLGHDFPGRTGAIRVDKQSPVETDTSGCVGGDFVTALASGQNVTTRFVKWPYDYPVDHTDSLTGLRSALDLTVFIRKNIDRITF